MLFVSDYHSLVPVPWRSPSSKVCPLGSHFGSAPGQLFLVIQDQVAIYLSGETPIYQKQINNMSSNKELKWLLRYDKKIGKYWVIFGTNNIVEKHNFFSLFQLLLMHGSPLVQWKAP